MNDIRIVEHGLSQGIYYNEAPMCTTEQLAQAYDATTKMLNDNFKNNKYRYKEGKHFIFLSGDELKEFKDYTENFGVVSKHTPQLYLWTKRGALMHAKSLNTDKAWEAYERLIDYYFEAPKSDISLIDNSTAFKKEAPGYQNNRHVMAVIQAIQSLLQEGYTFQPCKHGKAPTEPFLGFEDAHYLFIRSAILYDRYIQIIGNGHLNHPSLYQILATYDLIDNNDKAWLIQKGHSSYVYKRNSGGNSYYTLKFNKEMMQKL